MEKSIRLRSSTSAGKSALPSRRNATFTSSSRDRPSFRTSWIGAESSSRRPREPISRSFFAERLVVVIRSGDRERPRKNSVDALRDSFEMESDAVSLFVLFLLEPARFLWQQFTELQIRVTQSIRAVGIDMIVNERQDPRAPVVPVGFVLAHFVRQQRIVVS